MAGQASASCATASSSNSLTLRHHRKSDRAVSLTDPLVLSGSTAVAVWVDLCGSTPISIIGCWVPSLAWVGNPRPTSRLPATRWPRVMPLLSQTANGRRAGRHTRSEPTRGRQEVLEPARPTSCGRLRAANPTAIPLPSYKSGSTAVAARWCFRSCRAARDCAGRRSRRRCRCRPSAARAGPVPCRDPRSGAQVGGIGRPQPVRPSQR